MTTSLPSITTRSWNHATRSGRSPSRPSSTSPYAYYKYDEPAAAVAAADRFIKLHPQHPNVDYAYYLKGLVNYNQGKLDHRSRGARSTSHAGTRALRARHSATSRI